MNRDAFFDRARELFGPFSQAQVEGIEMDLDVAASRPSFPLTYTAYCLATDWHETGTQMQPVRETFADSTEQVIARLDRAWARGKLPQVKSAYWRKDRDGRAWYGRGKIQLTHKANYLKAEQLTGVPLSEDPDLALDARASAVILVVGMEHGVFTGFRLADFLTGRTDYVGARRIVNGQDHAMQIAVHARSWESALLFGAMA